MKVDHITLGGSNTVRDTEDILEVTITLLREAGFEVADQVVTLPFPRSKLTVKITVDQGIAAFDIMKDGHILYTNIACMDKDYRKEAIRMITYLRDHHPYLEESKVVIPVSDYFIYSIPVESYQASAEENMLCGEIELYIFYSLYLAYTKP